MTNNFDSIELKGWRQFSHIDIQLDAQSTVLTGVNGCGKTTILNVLSSHFGWNLNFIAAPLIGKRKREKLFSDRMQLLDQEEPNNSSTPIGSIRYTNTPECQLLLPPDNLNNPQYQLQYSNRPSLVGLHIPSHRPSMSFQRVQQLPTDPKNNQQQYQEFQSLLQQTYGGGNVRNPGLVLKQSLISLALFGYGNQAVAQNTEYRDLFEGFQEILAHILPKTLGFQKIEIRMPDVVLITSTGTFSLDAMSGGINSLFGIAWQIYMYGVDKGECTVIIDEPENHLHPSMQRTFLPSLERAFPNYRFIVATHSPFIVTSNRGAKVFALTYDGINRIRSQKIEMMSYAGSPEKILREILDVQTTIPIWAEEAVRDALRKYSQEPESREKIDKILADLREAGIDEALIGYGGDVEVD